MTVAVELYDFMRPSTVDVMPITDMAGGRGRGGAATSPVGGSRPRAATATRPAAPTTAAPPSRGSSNPGFRPQTPLIPRTGAANNIAPFRRSPLAPKPAQPARANNIVPFRRPSPKAQTSTPLPKTNPKPLPKPSARPMPATRPLSGANRDRTLNPVSNPVGGPQPPKPKPSGGTAGLPSPPTILHTTGGVPGGNYTLKFFDPSYFSEGVSLDYQLFGPVSNYRIVQQSDGYHVWARARTSALGDVQDVRLTGNNVIPNLTPQNTSFQLFKNFPEPDQPVFSPSTSPSPSSNPQPYSPLRAAPTIAPSPLAPLAPAPSVAPQISPVIAPPSLAPSTPARSLPSARPSPNPATKAGAQPRNAVRPQFLPSGVPWPITGSDTSTTEPKQRQDDCCDETLLLLRKIHNALFAEVEIDLTPKKCETEEKPETEPKEESSNPLENVTEGITDALSGSTEKESPLVFKGKRIELIDKAFAGLQDAADSQHLELCESESAIALPESWEVRTFSRPQLIVVWADVDGKKLGKSRWSMSIPHYIKPQAFTPQIPNYKRGKYLSTLVLKDNSKIIINAATEAAATTFFNAIKQLIDPKQLTNPLDLRFTHRKNAEIAEKTVKATFIKFYKEGDKTLVPEWTKTLK